jgi:hypothetical protein
MAQPTIEGLQLNAGTGGSKLAVDTWGDNIVQVILPAYSTGDGTGKAVMLDDGLPVQPQTGATFPVSLASVPSHEVTNAGTFAVQAAQSGTWNIGTVTTVSAVTAISSALPAGDNNIGNVDIATVPAPLNVVGNGAAATALRVSLANDSTGIVSLTTSTASIGKLAANSGVDIGDVDVTSVVPGTGATNLGKARGAAAGTSDTGVVAMGVVRSADSHNTDIDEGDYARLSLTNFRELRTRDQRAIDIANCNAYTDYTALNGDTDGLANSTNHVAGVGALTFNKINGPTNEVYGGVFKTFTAIDVSEIFEAGGFVGCGVYLPSLANVVNVFLRIGTDASNYNCWTWPVADLTAATWLNLRKSAMGPDYARNLGAGWNPAAIGYVAFGVEFAAEANTLAGIIFDHVHMVGGRVTSSDINAAISSSVTTPNVNINRVGGVATATSSGATNAGTLRIIAASDAPDVTSLGIIDDWDESDRCKVNLIVGQAGVAAGAGAVGATVQRMTLASDDPAVTSLQLLDNAISGAGFNITQFAGAAVPIGAGTEAAALRVTIATDSTGTLSIDDGGGAITVDGTVAVSGTVAVTGAFYQATQPVSLASVPSHAVTNAGTFAVQVDGAALTALQLIDDPIATIGTTPLMRVAIFDGSNSQITSFGGGTQYTEGDTDASITGTAILWEDAANTLVAVSAAKPLPISDAGGSITVDGTFWQATQPVSGTVTAELSATDNAVLDDIAASQTDASQKTQIVDGSGNVIGSTSNALDVNIKSGAGSGGTASDDDADFTAGTTSGTPAMGVYESSPSSVTNGDMGIVGITQTRAMRVSVDNSVTVDLGANNDVTLATLPDTAAGDLAAQTTDLAAIEVLLTTIEGNQLADGHNVTIDNANIAVTGTFWQATQPVSLAAVPSHEVTNAGTFPVQAAQSGTWNVGTVTTCSTVTNVSQLGGQAIAMGTGARSAGTLRVTVATDDVVPASQSGTWTVGLSAAQTLATVTTVGAVTTITNVVHVDDNAGSLTVDNNGTFAVQAVCTNAGTFAVQAACVLGAETTKVIGTVNVAAAQTIAVTNAGTFAVQAVCTNAGTFAVQATLAAETTKVIGTVNVAASQTIAVTCATAGNLNCTEANSAAIKAAVETLDNAISGSEMQVDVVASLPAGTNAIGKLAANSGVDIGDVDVLSIAAGTNTIGGVIAGERSLTSYDGTTSCTVKRFMAAAPSDGDSLIAAVADKKFRILSFGIISISGTICRFWLDDADAAVVFGNSTGFPLEEDSGAAAPGFILNHNPHGWFQTATANKALRIQFASGSGVVVFGTYIEVA